MGIIFYMFYEGFSKIDLHFYIICEIILFVMIKCLHKQISKILENRWKFSQYTKLILR